MWQIPQQARSIKAELMEEEVEDSDDEEYETLGVNALCNLFDKFACRERF